MEVFDRDDTYDPRLDPIVRVEARRLRVKLKQYYQREGNADAVRIEIPSRGYAPTFQCLQAPTEIDHQACASPSLLEPSLVVLSFADSGDDADSFVAGLSDEINFQLCATPGVQVAARTSALCSSRFGVNVTEIGRCLNVDYVLEGNVRREGANLRICVQLVSAASGFCVWKQAYEQEVKAVFEDQKRIAGQIAADTKAYLFRQPSHPLRPQGIFGQSAYALYSEGRSYLNSRTKVGINQSVDCFQRVIDTTPQYALAYAGLADAYSLGARYCVFPQQESWQRARSAALNAVRIDQSLAEAHASLGFVDLHYRRDWWSAEREFCTAILLNPSYAPARQWFGWYLAATGRHVMAVSAMEQAVRIDPLSANANADLALAHYFARDYERAIRQCQRTLSLEPGFYRAHQLAGLVYLQQANGSQAVDRLELAVSLADGNGRGSALLAHAYAAAGKLGKARQMLAKSIEAQKPRVSAVDIALFFAAIGDLDQVFEWLERAYLEHEAELLWLPVDPIYDRIRQDLRFPNFLRRLGSPPLSRLYELVLPTAPDPSFALPQAPS